MVFGRDVMLPMSAVVGHPVSEEIYESNDEYVEALRQTIKQVHETARENIGKSAIYQKKHYDTKAKLKKYKTGQLVWLHNPTRKRGVCSKLIQKWKGPYLVTRVLDDLICLVKTSRNHKPKAYHIDRLWPYTGTNIPMWIRRELAENSVDKLNPMIPNKNK
jgi:hypothetical protein